MHLNAVRRFACTGKNCKIIMFVQVASFDRCANASLTTVQYVHAACACYSLSKVRDLMHMLCDKAHEDKLERRRNEEKHMLELHNQQRQRLLNHVKNL